MYRSITESQEDYFERIKKSSSEEILRMLFSLIIENDDLKYKIDQFSELKEISERDHRIAKLELRLKALQESEDRHQYDLDAAYSESKEEIQALKGSKEFYKKEVLELKNKIKAIANGKLEQDNLLLAHKLESIEKGKMPLNLEAYSKYFFMALEDEIHDMNIKPGIREFINNLIEQQKHSQKPLFPEDAFRQLAERFSSL
jgi:hypothetical protein